MHAGSTEQDEDILNPIQFWFAASTVYVWYMRICVFAYMPGPNHRKWIYKQEIL